MSSIWSWGLASGATLGASIALAAVDATPHNLSAGSGSGELCAFCHITAHASGPNRAAWDHDRPPTVYKLYESSTLQSTLRQPTGASRLCLSCHDGTTALGSLGRRPDRGALSTVRLTASASLGTDLSDDHPISFVYDAALALEQGQLADPAGVAKGLPLDASRQLQCTTCHDPHNQRYRKFLRMDDRGAALCSACHRQRGWGGSSHATARARMAAGAPDAPNTTVLESGCDSCHRTHAAPHPSRLLASAQEGAVCLGCHNGTVAASNLEVEISKSSAHRVASTDWTHDPREDPSTMPPHAACTDCHNPHQAVATSASAPAVSGRLRGVRGVTIGGRTVAEASYEYEICLRCHGLQDETSNGIIRQDAVRNVRQEIAPGNPSFHPVAAAGKNTTMEGFEPEYSRATVVYCTDCHNNDEWTASGRKPRGPHGSRYAPILERNYETSDPATESFLAYALCYKCHNRDYLINDRAGTFPHRMHVVEQQAPCAACHDAHGSRDNVGLVNFMLRDREGRVVAAPSQNRRQIEYLSLGPGRGQCFLLCHGKNHDPASYP